MLIKTKTCSVEEQVFNIGVITPKSVKSKKGLNFS